MTDLHLCTCKQIGDEVCLTAIVKAIQETYPGTYNIHIHTGHPEVYNNNPYVCTVSPRGPKSYRIWYGGKPYEEYKGSLIGGFRVSANTQLHMNLPICNKSDIHLATHELIDPTNSWIINAGWQDHCTSKAYDRYQEIIDLCPDIRFIQVGSPNDNHIPLQGSNVTNLIGKTTLREVFSLVHSSIGTISPPSNLVHVASCWDIPSIVLVGGREDYRYTAYPSAHHFYTEHPVCGKPKCMCFRGCSDTIGGAVPRCMHILDPIQIANKIKEITKARSGV